MVAAFYFVSLFLHMNCNTTLWIANAP